MPSKIAFIVLFESGTCSSTLNRSVYGVNTAGRFGCMELPYISCSSFPSHSNPGLLRSLLPRREGESGTSYPDSGDTLYSGLSAAPFPPAGPFSLAVGTLLQQPRIPTWTIHPNRLRRESSAPVSSTAMPERTNSMPERHRCKSGALTGRCRRNLILLLRTQSPPTRRTHDAGDISQAFHYVVSSPFSSFCTTYAIATDASESRCRQWPELRPLTIRQRW